MKVHTAYGVYRQLGVVEYVNVVLCIRRSTVELVRTHDHRPKSRSQYQDR